MAKIDINGTILDTQYASQAEYLLGKAGKEINDVNDLKNALEGKGLAPYERFGQVIVEGNVVTTKYPLFAVDDDGTLDIEGTKGHIAAADVYSQWHGDDDVNERAEEARDAFKEDHPDSYYGWLDHDDHDHDADDDDDDDDDDDGGLM